MFAPVQMTSSNVSSSMTSSTISKKKLNQQQKQNLWEQHYGNVLKSMCKKCRGTEVSIGNFFVNQEQIPVCQMCYAQTSQPVVSEANPVV